MSATIAGPKIIHAPFTVEQVATLNEFQSLGNFHPYTCGSGHRTDAAHLDGEGVLQATETGWECPYCDYKQGWAMSFMADPAALDTIRSNDRSTSRF